MGSRKFGMIKLRNVINVKDTGSECYVGWDKSGRAWVHWAMIEGGNVSDCCVREDTLDMMAGCECSAQDGRCECEKDYNNAK